jgi:dCMP deaminase
MAITIGIKKFVCLDEYPETDYDLVKEAGVEIEILNNESIDKWASKMIAPKE